METPLEQTPEYRAALCRVRQLRGFYTHLSVYLAVNAGCWSSTWSPRRAGCGWCGRWRAGASAC